MEDFMVLLIILLIVSVGLNIALIFGIVRKNADEDIMIIRMREGLNTD
jgi:hypothetical protein